MISEKTKDEVIEELADWLKSGMFGDGLEDDYVRDGINFKGLNNMSDQELLDELLGIYEEDHELVKKVRGEMEVHKMLSGE